MSPRAILISALLLAVIVAVIIVGWTLVGDRPGPLNTRVFSHVVDVGLEPPSRFSRNSCYGCFLTSSRTWA